MRRMLEVRAETDETRILYLGKWKTEFFRLGEMALKIRNPYDGITEKTRKRQQREPRPKPTTPPLVCFDCGHEFYANYVGFKPLCFECRQKRGLN